MTNFTILSVFMFLFTACNGADFHSRGYLTTLKTKNFYRMPASVLSSDLTFQKFKQFQDTRQIYVFCKLQKKQVRTESCYQEKFNERLREFAKLNGPLNTNSIQLIKKINSYDYVKDSFELIEKNMSSKLNDSFELAVKKRSDYCRENSKINLHKCMNQYLKRDTFNILNQFQAKNESLNAQEYLYVKNIIEENLSKKLFMAKLSLKK